MPSKYILPCYLFRFVNLTYFHFFKGIIETSEIIAVLKSLGINISETQAKKIIQRSALTLIFNSFNFCLILVTGGYKYSFFLLFLHFFPFFLVLIASPFIDNVLRNIPKKFVEMLLTKTGSILYKVLRKRFFLLPGLRMVLILLSNWFKIFKILLKYKEVHNLCIQLDEFVSKCIPRRASLVALW